MLIKPHGGVLVNRVLKGKDLQNAEATVSSLPKLTVSREILREVENIATGVFSPLQGFLLEEELENVLHQKRLIDGTPWTIPIVLDVDRESADRLDEGSGVALADESGTVYAVLHLEEKYFLPRSEFSRFTYGTEDTSHPGVARTEALGEILLGGKVSMVRMLENAHMRFYLTPKETRFLFRERGWKTVCAFQTRNVPHRAHEHLQKTVLGITDGLLVHPLIGKKKKGDFTDTMIVETYDALAKHYYPKERVVLSILCTEMRYAGPREAIHHAIMRKNHGCTHFIVGRDHAGVGGFYHPEAAIEIFDEFEDLQIQPVMLRGDHFHCRKCMEITSERCCPHPEEEKIPFSGTVVRKMLAEKKAPPVEIMRPEVFDIIANSSQPFVE